MLHRRLFHYIETILQAKVEVLHGLELEFAGLEFFAGEKYVNFAFSIFYSLPWWASRHLFMGQSGSLNTITL